LGDELVTSILARETSTIFDIYNAGQHMKALLTLLKTDRAPVDAFSIEQIVALCGNGKLADNSDTCHEFREYLQIADSENLFKYLETCFACEL
jgi:hypothetical protein